MKRYFSLLMGVLGFVPILAQQSDYYYYYKGNRIDLTVDSTRLYVVSEGELNLTNTTSVRTAEFHISHSTKSQIYNIVESMYKQRSAMPMSEVFLSTVSISEGLNKSQYDMLVKNVKETNGVWQVLPSFFIKEKSVNVTNNFYVKLKSAEDYSKLQQMVSQYNIEIIGYNKFMPLWYTLSCTASSTLNAIEAANLFHRSSLFACSEPEFSYSFSAVDSNDELYELQWNLLNTGQDGGTQGIDINVERAWETTKGNGIVVAVFDQGVNISHPDLVNNIYSAGYDASTDTEPSTIINGSAHGTACAGIIAAMQNNAEEGISGVAPEAKILPISVNLVSGEYTGQQLANGINWAWRNGADIISNSWGGMNGIGVLDEAIDSALCYGRNGKGCVLVFSAGNDSVPVHYPANSDPRILAVGGITPWGNRTVSGFLPNEYLVNFDSNYGQSLDIVAPSVLIQTTDIIGSAGYAAGNYFGAFGGTSAACPHVSGVAALVLSVDPGLTTEEVAAIIESSARKVRPDLYTYQNDNVHANGTWNSEVGYGLLDASAAVDIAKATAVTTYIKNKVFDDSVSDTYYRDINVELENVTVEPGGVLEIEKENTVLLKSSVKVKKDGFFMIF